MGDSIHWFAAISSGATHTVVGRLGEERRILQSTHLPLGHGWIGPGLHTWGGVPQCKWHGVG